MKKLFCILIAAAMLCLNAAVVVVADTADIVHESVEGTAVIDGVKDEAYDGAQALEFVQQGDTNGNGQVNDYSDATAYVINDAEYAYVFVDVHDDNLDNSGSIAYDRDSVELFWMVDNAKTQIRYHYDGTVDEDSGVNVESAAVVTDTGYVIEAKIPLSDVRNNQLEMCIQINVCTDGLRQYTCYIEGNAEGDRAYARENRQSTNDCWWTLALAGEHADTITDDTATPAATTDDTTADDTTADDTTTETTTPVNTVVQEGDNLYPVELDDYNGLSQIPFMTRIFTQNDINWKLVELGAPLTGVLGDTIEANWTDTKFLIQWVETDTNDYTLDPKLILQISDNGILQEGLESGAATGDLGYLGYYTFTYTDITITSDGYEDVVLPGQTIENYKLQAKQEAGWISGAAYEINLMPMIKEQLGLTTEQVCDYIYNLTSFSTTVSFDAYNGVTVEALADLQAQAEAEEAAVIENLAQYTDRVDAAEEIVNDETSTDLTAKRDAAQDAMDAANEALAAAEGYPNATETANELLDRAETLMETVVELEEEAEEAAQEEEEANTPAPAEDDTSSDSSSSSSTVVIIVIVAVVVVAAIIIIIVVAGKKKKK